MIRAIWLVVFFVGFQSIQCRSIAVPSLQSTSVDEQNGNLDNVLKREKKSPAMVFPFR